VASRKRSKKPDGVTSQKPRTNIYTMMLLLSLIAIITACVLLWMALKKYGDWPQWKISQAPAASATLYPGGDLENVATTSQRSSYGNESKLC